MRKMNKKGFTIVELVIVIAVIAILAAAMIPAFSNIIDKANESAALQEADAALTNDLILLDGQTSKYPAYKKTEDTAPVEDKKYFTKGNDGNYSEATELGEGFVADTDYYEYACKGEFDLNGKYTVKIDEYTFEFANGEWKRVNP